MALTRDQVVDAALALSDEAGLDALSLRSLATRLGVQAPTLYWHVANKAALLDAVSDAIMGEAIDALAAGPDGSWEDAFVAAFRGLRTALVAHRDGARIVSDARDSLRRAEFSERVIADLRGARVDASRAWLLVMTANRYTLGHVLAEQGPDGAPTEEEAGDFARSFPLLAEGVAGFFGSGGTSAELHERGLRQLAGLAPLS